MSQIVTTVEADLASAHVQQITRSLVSYNDTQAPPADHRDLIVVAREGETMVGGLLGHTHWNWLFVQVLWVAAEFRGHGVGSHLLGTAEQEASGRGCSHAHCDTFDFQALPFYQKLGYHVFGRLEDYPPGHTRYFLQKRDLGQRNNPDGTHG